MNSMRGAAQAREPVLPLKIDFSEYAQEIVSALFDAYREKTKNIVLHQQTELVFLSLESAMACGLILTELVSNSLKHAFVESLRGEITITVETLHGKEVMIEVTDNGVGLPTGLSFEHPRTFGHRLVHHLVQQLHGQIRLKNEHGASFIVNFSEP